MRPQGCRLLSTPLRKIAQVSLLFLAIGSLAGFLLSACSTTQTRFQEYHSGQWESRTVIRDNKSGKSHVVDLDLISVYPSKLRCEVTTSFGVHLASVAMNEQKIAYLVTRQKKYYSGKVSSNSLKAVLNLSVDPRLIVQLLFDSPLPSGEWRCEGLQKDAPAHCFQSDPKLTSPLEVTWLERERARRKIQIASKDFSLTLELKGFKPNVQVPEATFDLAQPPGFEVLSAWNRRQSPAY